MKLENQLILLGQAITLKQLGVSQDAYFHHFFQQIYIGVDWYGAYGAGACSDSYAAFSVPELGEMMKDMDPYHITSFYNPLRNIWNCTLWKIDTFDEKGQPDGFINAGEVYGITEAECRAEMLIHVLQEQFISVTQINRQLQSA